VDAQGRRERPHPFVLASRQSHVYGDQPDAREVGHVGEAAGIATSAWVTEGHDITPDVLTSVVHWRKGGDPTHKLDWLRRRALEGVKCCRNDGCEVVGHLKDFKVCPQCKIARYCGNACQKQTGPQSDNTKEGLPFEISLTIQ